MAQVQMPVHELKCWPDSFVPIRDGIKTCEFRNNDRDFHEHEVLLLREFAPCEQCKGEGKINDPQPMRFLTVDKHVMMPCPFCGGSCGNYTNQWLRCVITHVLRGPAYGIPAGYAMMSIRLIGVGHGEIEKPKIRGVAAEHIIYDEFPKP